MLKWEYKVVKATQHCPGIWHQLCGMPKHTSLLAKSYPTTNPSSMEGRSPWACRTMAPGCGSVSDSAGGRCCLVLSRGNVVDRP